jgi:hypothetical protein
MTRANLTAVLMAACVAAVSGQGKPAGVEPPDLSGTWKLNREQSQFPKDLGFGMDIVGGGKVKITDESGRGGGTSVSPGLAVNRPASREEAMNSRQLVDEVRNPPEQLTVVLGPGTVKVTSDKGRERTYYPDGRESFVDLEAAPVATVTRWEAGRLIIRYKVEPAREVRYTVSRKSSPAQLVVQVDLVERGGRDTATRVYDLAGTSAAPAPATAAAPQAQPVLPLPSQRPAAAPAPSGMSEPMRPVVPAVPAAAAPADLDSRPDAELKGIASLGIVVEELGQEAVACGLKQDALTAAVSKSLSGAGLKVVQNSDEDTYVYVHVVTVSAGSGYCFSRYDAYVYSNTTATMSYGSRPVLVQVSLLHKGGVSGSGTSTHADTVTRALAQYVDQFAARIRSANK